MSHRKPKKSLQITGYLHKDGYHHRIGYLHQAGLLQKAGYLHPVIDYLNKVNITMEP